MKTTLFLLLFTLLSVFFLNNNLKPANAVSYEDLSKKMQQACKTLIKEFQATDRGVGGTHCFFTDVRFPAPRKYEDITNVVQSIDLEVYQQGENRAKKDVELMDESREDTLSEEDRIIKTTKIPGGFVQVIKDKLKQFDNDWWVGDMTFVQQKGACRLWIVSRSTSPEIEKYHTFSVDKIKGEVYYDNKHPGFRHDREEELLFTTKQVVNTIWQISKDACGVKGDTSSPEDKQEYTRSELDQRPQASDFTKVSIKEFTKVYPVSTISATPSPKITPKVFPESTETIGDIFVGKIDGEGKIDIELPNGQTITLKDNKTWVDPYDVAFNANPHYGLLIERPQFLFISLEPLKKDPRILYCSLSSYLKSFGDISKISIKVDKANWCYEVTLVDGMIRVLTEDNEQIYSLPNGTTITAQKGDFLVGYNSFSEESVIEIYDGSLTVKNKAGQSKTISSSYGTQIKRIEADQNGEMTEKIAIPKSQWEAFLTSQQRETESEISGNVSPFLVVIVILGMGGVIFFLYRKKRLPGKLIKLINSLSQRIRKSKTLQEEEN